ncbi:MAG: hypothetical protein ABI811_06400 [Acidobacteriota bacterium]
MNSGTRVWLWPNLLSLDAPVVALLWQLLFVRCFHASLGFPVAMLLGMSVWLIYAADRMLDAWRGADLQARHQFYRRHWRGVAVIWFALFLVCAWIAWTSLSSATLGRGSLLAAAAGLYLVAVHAFPKIWRRPGWKEASVSVLFALGASLAAWSAIASWSDILSIALFCVLCWMNCTTIEDWEQGRPARGAVLGLAVVVAVMAVVMSGNRPVLACAETASACGLVFLDRYWWRLSPDQLRVLADVALLTPILFLQVAGKLA